VGCDTANSPQHHLQAPLLFYQAEEEDTAVFGTEVVEVKAQVTDAGSRFCISALELPHLLSRAGVWDAPAGDAPRNVVVLSMGRHEGGSGKRLVLLEGDAHCQGCGHADHKVDPMVMCDCCNR